MEALLKQFEHWVENLFGNVSTGGSFLVIGLIFGALLLISFVLDGIFDALNFGDGPLSLTTIGAFGALFGFTGYVAYAIGVSGAIAALIGAIVGLLGGVGAYYMSKFFQNSTSSASFSSSELVEQTAIVTVPIPGNNSYGEVAVHKNGQRYTFAAIAKTEINLGTNVRIVSNLTSSSVLVEPLPEA